MSVLVFTLRASLVALAIAAQAYLVFTYGIEVGVGYALAYQTGLQVIAAIVAPHRLRALAAALAGWVSIVVAIVLAFSWVTIVIPVGSLIGWVQSGDSTYFLGLVGLTLYLAIPAAVIVAAHVSDEN